MIRKRSQPFCIRTAGREQKRSTRLRVEPLEDRLTPSLTPTTEIPGQLLIGWQPGTTDAEVADFYGDHGLTEIESFRFGDKPIALVATPTAETQSLIATLGRDPRVRYAEPNVGLTPGQVSNDPTLARDWGFVNAGQTAGTPDADIDADEAWDITTGSSE